MMTQVAPDSLTDVPAQRAADAALSFHDLDDVHIYEGDCLQSLRRMPAGSVHTCVTSPPYFGLRDYGVDGQIGLESTPDAFVSKLVEVFREVRRVLRDDGTLWLNLGDSYAAGAGGRGDIGNVIAGVQTRTASVGTGRVKRDIPVGLKPKDLIGIPWTVAFALRADGWHLRQDIIWSKPNPMPESVTDRCTKAHEYLFLLSKSPRYYYDHEAVKETASGRETYFGSDRYSIGSGRNDSGQYNPSACATRNRRSVWTVSTKPYKGAHFATFPPKLIEPCILAGSPVGGTVLDPFGGSGTTAEVALQHGRKAVLCELNPAYIELQKQRIAKVERPLSPEVAA